MTSPWKQVLTLSKCTLFNGVRQLSWLISSLQLYLVCSTGQGGVQGGVGREKVREQDTVFLYSPFPITHCLPILHCAACCMKTTGEESASSQCLCHLLWKMFFCKPLCEKIQTLATTKQNRVDRQYGICWLQSQRIVKLRKKFALAWESLFRPAWLLLFFCVSEAGLIYWQCWQWYDFTNRRCWMPARS